MEQRERLELLNGATAAENLQEEAEAQRRVRRSEESAVAQSMGWHDPHDSTGDDDVRQTILGDYIQQQPQPTQPQPTGSGLMPKLLMAAAIAGMAGTPIGLGIAAPAIIEALREKPAPTPAPEKPDQKHYLLELAK